MVESKLVYYVSMRLKAIIGKSLRLVLACACSAIGLVSNSIPGGCVTVADGTQKRIYEVRIDDKPAGNYQLKIINHGKDIDVTSDCEVNHRVLVFHYHYKYRGHEQWTADAVMAFESESDDNGKHCTITASAGARGLELKVNGKTLSAGADTLTSSYWHLPRPADRISAKYLEVDSGRVFNADMVRVGDEPIKIGDRLEVCHHYKLSGGDSGDLWYDSEYRLVRQTSSDSGHKTTVQLQAIER